MRPPNKLDPFFYSRSKLTQPIRYTFDLTCLTSPFPSKMHVDDREFELKSSFTAVILSRPNKDRWTGKFRSISTHASRTEDSHNLLAFPKWSSTSVAVGCIWPILVRLPMRASDADTDQPSSAHGIHSANADGGN